MKLKQRKPSTPSEHDQRCYKEVCLSVATARVALEDADAWADEIQDKALRERAYAEMDTLL